MVPVSILILFFILLTITRFVIGTEKITQSFCGRASMAVMLVFTGIAHFTRSTPMVEMIPDFIPYPLEVVYGTGLIEILAAIGLLTKRFCRVTSIMLILFFLMILPANVIGALKKVELGGMDKGLSYLYFRIPLQFFFMIWTYYFGIRRTVKAASPKKK